MESPPVARYTPHQSKKRVFPGGTSSYMDPDIVEITPPINRSSKLRSLKQKEVIYPEVIDVDMDDDFGDVVLIDGKVDTNKKGKEPLANFSLGPSGDGVQSSKISRSPGSQNIANLDGFSSDLSYGDDDYMDMYYDDFIYDDDEYTILQSHFDNIDIPPGVEAPIPWLTSTYGENKSATSDISAHSILGTQSNEAGSLKSSSSLPTQIDDVSQPHKAEQSSSWLKLEPAQTTQTLFVPSSSTYTSSHGPNDAVPCASKSFKSWRSKRKPSFSGGSSHHNFYDQLGGIKHLEYEPLGGSFLSKCTKKLVGRSNGSPYSSFPMPLETDDFFPKTQSLSGAPAYSGFIDPFYTGFTSNVGAYPPWFQDPANLQMTDSAVGSTKISSGSPSCIDNYGNEDEILKKYQLFKKFDTVQDYSDHHYTRNGSSSKQPPKNWAKKIQQEWKILEKDLPDTIFVRVYESRMDLLRAAIVGAEGTPYHDGLFFFDVFFPSSYPNVPPQVYYHSGGLRINPNLYDTGKVCLSLLNTWGGSQKEKWLPGVSTMLQVLVSIQGLILNSKPYFNEPGYAHSSRSADGQMRSLQYNESTFILSLKTMVYNIRRPPKHFEDLVAGHFCTHAHDILVACKAYMDGAQVGCLVRGGVQDVDEGDKSCSQMFKGNLVGHVKMLVDAFTKVGAKDFKNFLPLT
ncbi:hypothetical protein RJ639_017613 [Escallonia herrerae]|uniref:E2 ubiquitin-conjugating enzyme n=1 Tax=Escallonia herrerae TaxID=1293975 RepID=A0AA89AKJ2_9ASTE|nr:hypothetical protein RJ639_017613 [Escallonia herrerae]